MRPGGWISGASLTSHEPVHTDPGGVIGHLGTLRLSCAVMQTAIVQHTLTERIVTDFVDECTRAATALARLLETPDENGDPQLAAAVQAVHTAVATDAPAHQEGSWPTSTTWSSAPSASAADSTPPGASPTVRDVEELAKSPGDECPNCAGTGVMRWQQPVPDGNGGMILRDMEHPCPRGCGGQWKHPAAENHLVIDTPSDAPARVQGQAAAANRMPPALAAEVRRAFAKYSRE